MSEVRFIRKNGRIIPIKKDNRLRDGIVGVGALGSGAVLAETSGRSIAKVMKASNQSIRMATAYNKRAMFAANNMASDRILERLIGKSDKHAYRGGEFAKLARKKVLANSKVSALLVGYGASKIADSLGIEDQSTKSAIGIASGVGSYTLINASYQKVLKGTKRRNIVFPAAKDLLAKAVRFYARKRGIIK